MRGFMLDRKQHPGIPKEAAVKIPTKSRSMIASSPSLSFGSSRKRVTMDAGEDVGRPDPLADDYVHVTKSRQRLLSPSFIHHPRPGSASFSCRYRKALTPIRILLTLFGRLPIISVKKKDGRVYFKHHPAHPPSLLFYFSSILLTAALALVLFNLGGVLLHFPSQPESYSYSLGGVRVDKSRDLLRAEESYVFRRNIVPILAVAMSLMHCVISSYSLFRRRAYIPIYFNYWLEALEYIRIDGAKGVRTYMYTILGVYFGITLVIVGLGSVQFIAIGSGGPAMFMILLTRAFLPYVHSVPYFGTLRLVGAIFYVYVMICSKLYILLFLFKCKLLKNVISSWNRRLERVLHKRESDASEEEHELNRTGYTHLFKDHVCILDLLEGCDSLFSNIVETYYSTQVAGVCFEVYYFYRSQAAKEEFDRRRQWDGILMLFYLSQTLFCLITVSMNAADVSEEATQGLEVIRKKGMLSKKTDHELYFMLSMYISYTGYLQPALMGGKYFTIDRSFLVTITGIIFSYFIILIQFTPKLIHDIHDPMNLENTYLNQDVVDALNKQVEGLRF